MKFLFLLIPQRLQYSFSQALKAGCAIALLLPGAVVWADEQVVAIPGQDFRIRLEAPAITVVSALRTPPMFVGSSDRLRFAIYIDPMTCPGIDTNEKICACYTKALGRYPSIDQDTKAAIIEKNGVRVSYTVKLAPVNGVAGSIFNSDLVFARNAKLIAFHIGLFSPTPDGMAAVNSILDSVVVEEVQ